MFRNFNIDHLRVLNGFQYFAALRMSMMQPVKRHLTYRDRKTGVGSTYHRDDDLILRPLSAL